MDDEAQESGGSGQNITSRLYAAIAVVAGAAFAVVALLNAPGISYAIVAVLAGSCYTLVGIANRGRRQPRARPRRR
jgi:hypothetical protein